jgi:hypothetical protein
MINDANVVIADIIACNGVVHVIDAVLLPPEEKKHHYSEKTEEMHFSQSVKEESTSDAHIAHTIRGNGPLDKIMNGGALAAYYKFQINCIFQRSKRDFQHRYEALRRNPC